ncbi:MAG TPA: F0F1 ATP synthase subunit delta, partial [Cryobacterium sp.]|nr:F0F1 ATP synthase subunit delta [Cryobacterium sp.]
MRGTSRASLQSARYRFEPVLAAAGVQALTLGEELFALVDALDSSASLRRTLTDPSIDADAKGALAAGLLTAADPRTVELV